MSEEYRPLPSVLEALADLRSQVENCDGTAQIDTDVADAVLAANMPPTVWIPPDFRDPPPNDRESRLLLRLAYAGVGVPVPLSERKPGPEDCLEVKTTEYTMHFCWLCRPVLHYGEERLIWDWKMIPMANERGWEKWTYWLPASAKYLPARVEG